MTKSKKELRDEIERILDRHSLGMMKNKEWKNMNIDELLSLFNKENKAKEEEVVERVEKIKELIKTDGPWTSENDGYDEAFDKGYNKCLEDVLSILKPNDSRCKCGNPKMDESNFCKDCI